jgi:hypothetical protein
MALRKYLHFNRIITKLYNRARKKFNDGQNYVADLNTLSEEYQETPQERKKRLNRIRVEKYR